ncbi:hypothetical protein CCP2SC5_800002 [Azospirillaceae bacterium]
MFIIVIVPLGFYLMRSAMFAVFAVLNSPIGDSDITGDGLEAKRIKAPLPKHHPPFSGVFGVETDALKLWNRINHIWLKHQNAKPKTTSTDQTLRTFSE